MFESLSDFFSAFWQGLLGLLSVEVPIIGVSFLSLALGCFAFCWVVNLFHRLTLWSVGVASSRGGNNDKIFRRYTAK